VRHFCLYSNQNKDSHLHAKETTCCQVESQVKTGCIGPARRSPQAGEKEVEASVFVGDLRFVGMERREHFWGENRWMRPGLVRTRVGVSVSVRKGSLHVNDRTFFQ
jgi:hypothetical protein